MARRTYFSASSLETGTGPVPRIQARSPSPVWTWVHTTTLRALSSTRTRIAPESGSPLRTTTACTASLSHSLI